MSVQTLRQQLSQLKLQSAATELDSVLGAQNSAVSLDWIIKLLEMEIDVRKEAAIQSRIKKAHFPEVKTLESFNFQFNPQINEPSIRELSNLQFVSQNGILLLLGQPGTGKTHIAISLGMLAARAGHKVFCTSAKVLHAEIRRGLRNDSLDSLFKKILSAKLWIIDDWGVVSFPRDIAEEIFDLLDRRKQNSAMILTSNRDVEEWPQVFADPVLANAAIDRMFEHAKSVIFRGPSYRLKGRIEIKNIDSNFELE
jgi:DNA replication protein DnaC